jgi:hypothetical protein
MSLVHILEFRALAPRRHLVQLTDNLLANQERGFTVSVLIRIRNSETIEDGCQQDLPN